MFRETRRTRLSACGMRRGTDASVSSWSIRSQKDMAMSRCYCGRRRRDERKISGQATNDGAARSASADDDARRRSLACLSSALSPSLNPPSHRAQDHGRLPCTPPRPLLCPPGCVCQSLPPWHSRCTQLYVLSSIHPPCFVLSNDDDGDDECEYTGRGQVQTGECLQLRPSRPRSLPRTSNLYTRTYVRPPPPCPRFLPHRLSRRLS
ncbi:hypothetical protein L227DRAFT_346612 [Lentinus tigrinus ALCF2SS1-6]|uniref:Uncharacterized protein n=1 Tax=Lentinus tigrinus ALCF2SS1-6 TaxID=1328759 RepID=A0A5C2RWB8_9APHY|nr:hypothetical protein L227DRAFT_346612 [Lentinus tigrinus ALCF2SS1-6]